MRGMPLGSRTKIVATAALLLLACCAAVPATTALVEPGGGDSAPHAYRRALLRSSVHVKDAVAEDAVARRALLQDDAAAAADANANAETPAEDAAATAEETKVRCADARAGGTRPVLETNREGRSCERVCARLRLRVAFFLSLPRVRARD